MKVIAPLTIDSSMVTIDTVETYADWAIGTTYAAGDKVVYGDWVYESLTSSNLGNQPDTDAVNWVLSSPSNAWAMFDGEVSTRSEKTTTFTATVTPGAYFNSIALLNMSAISVDVTADYGDGSPLTYSYDLNETVIADWYGYFFEPYSLREDLVITDIPPSLSVDVTITVTNESGVTAAVGMVKFGTLATLGDSEYGANLGITDYSVKETDAFGVTTFVERPFSKRLSANVFCQNGALTYITSVLQSVRAKPTVWVYSDQDKFRPTVVYGYARDWNVDIAYTNHCLLSLEIEGLT